MRYGKNHKSETRARILEIASARFRRDGVGGVGIQSLMADAGLTHGGFYAHFPSKTDLVADAVRAAFEQTGNLLARAVEAAGPEDRLGAFIDAYLSELHCTHVEQGCVGAALAPELARMGPAVKKSFTTGLLTIVDGLAALLAPGGSPGERRERAMSIFGALMGAVQLARALDNRDLAAATLAETRRLALEQAHKPWRQ